MSDPKCPQCYSRATLEDLRHQIPDPHPFVSIVTGLGGMSNESKASAIGEPSTCACCGIVYNPRAAALANEYRRKIEKLGRKT